jgi:hypothetical protein
MDTISDRIITAPVGEFCRLSGLGRTKVYELLGDGTLASITIGKRRLIVLDSYRSLIKRQGSLVPANQPAASVPRRRGPVRFPPS